MIRNISSILHEKKKLVIFLLVELNVVQVWVFNMQLLHPELSYLPSNKMKKCPVNGIRYTNKRNKVYLSVTKVYDHLTYVETALNRR